MKQLLMIAMLVASGPAIASNTKPVPTEDAYIGYCMPVQERTEPGGTFGSIIDKALAEATCKCQFKKISVRRVMTKDQFMNAAIVCDRERRANFEAFIYKYLR